MKLKLLTLTSALLVSCQVNANENSEVITEWFINSQGVAISPLTEEGYMGMSYVYMTVNTESDPEFEIYYKMHLVFLSKNPCDNKAPYELTWETGDQLVNYLYMGCENASHGFAKRRFIPVSKNGKDYLMSLFITNDTDPDPDGLKVGMYRYSAKGFQQTFLDAIDRSTKTVL